MKKTVNTTESKSNLHSRYDIDSNERYRKRCKH